MKANLCSLYVRDLYGIPPPTTPNPIIPSEFVQKHSLANFTTVPILLSNHLAHANDILFLTRSTFQPTVITKTASPKDTYLAQLFSADTRGPLRNQRNVNSNVTTTEPFIKDVANSIKNHSNLQHIAPTPAIINLTEILGSKTLPYNVVIPMTVIYSIILVTGLFGNIMTCTVIAKMRSMHTATNYYLFNLAIADLLSLIIGMPQELYSMWVQYPYPFGAFMCALRVMVAEMTTYSSILCITAFTIERYFAICHPLRAHAMSNLNRVLKIIAAVWVIACINAVPFSMFTQINYVCDYGDRPIEESAWCGVPFGFSQSSKYIPLLVWSALAFLVMPMGILIVLYIKIGLKLRSSARTMLGLKNFSTKPNATDESGSYFRKLEEARNKNKFEQQKTISSSQQTYNSTDQSIIPKIWNPRQAQSKQSILTIGEEDTEIVDNDVDENFSNTESEISGNEEFDRLSLEEQKPNEINDKMMMPLKDITKIGGLKRQRPPLTRMQAFTKSGESLENASKNNSIITDTHTDSLQPKNDNIDESNNIGCYFNKMNQNVGVRFKKISQNFTHFNKVVDPKLLNDVNYVADKKGYHKKPLIRKNHPTRSEQKRSRSRNDAIRMLVAVVVTFFICWAPFNAQRLFFVFNHKWTPERKAVLEKLFNITGCLYYANSTVNPILYNLMSKKFRKAFLSLLCPALCKTKHDKHKNFINHTTKHQMDAKKFELQSKNNA